MVSTATNKRLARRRPAAPPRRRLAPAARRQELLRVAAELITRRGVDGVQFAEVAAAAGVTRPLVYKFFPSRQALIIAVLEDYAAALTERFGRRSLDTIPGGVEDVALVFVEAVADTIETYGAGPWHLLDSKGPDPEVARRGQAIMDRLMAPWRAQMAARLRISPRDAATLARMIVAAGRAALELWCAGALSRAEAVRDSTRGVSALLQAFAAPPRRATKGPRPGEDTTGRRARYGASTR